MHPTLFLIDFDGTITLKYDAQWNSLTSIMAILRQWDYLWDEYKLESQALFDHYYALELDPSHTPPQKIQIMDERRRKHYEVLRKYWLTKRHIQQAINSWALQIRPWTDALFEYIRESWSYAVIFSANGLWTIAIEMAAQKYDLPLDQYTIISNSHDWNEDGTMSTEHEPVITSANKHTIIAADYPPELTKKLSTFTHWVVLGDSIWDLGMQQFSPLESVQTFWFAHPNQVDEFTQQFDHVLWERASFEEVINLLK